MISWAKILGLLAASAAAVPAAANSTTALATCQAIEKEISSQSSLIYADSLNFASDIHHWFLSSTQVPTCVLEAGSPQDVSTALKYIAANKTPFAVKSGGHASNPGFSSTTGVHIVFNQNLQQTTLSADKSTVEIGMGQTWSQVYSTLQGSGVNVVGGRTVGPGVGGFTLGGGFSWKTNQYGLTCDNVHAFNMVLPNGTITQVTAAQPDLFFALKGGQNRFGIVTSISYLTHPQAATIYGGLAFYGPSSTPAVLNATQEFCQTNTDPKAQIITTMEGTAAGASALVLFFHDEATRPASFAGFNSIVPIINTVKAQTFSSFVSSIPATLQTNDRGTFQTLSTSSLTARFLAAVANETTYYGQIMALHGGTTVNYDIEPFLPYGKHATDSAYPHADSPLPLNLYFAWIGQTNDAFWYAAIKASADRLAAVARAEGIMPADYTLYPNYAISGTSASALYGAPNAARLATIRKAVDPDGVMNLAGGFDV